ncbi:GntR family transcriptional regulator [uncultured Ruminococcus sp.]|uniref:GntR family transcriptional regulator n=2 Tax=uncultured Ruminococcus sp. TaxID=165186 RepID=UPI0029425E97|nr:GntR family transcriptional regulator [uncultured Ruminococcus sp.]
MIYIDNDNTKPLYLQIYESIRQNVLCGMLPKNTALPPIRTMANELKVSKNTVGNTAQLPNEPKCDIIETWKDK